MINNEIKIKYLEFIQMVVNRQANNSFLIKGWMIGLFSAGLGFSINQNKPPILLLVIFLIIILWLLDAYYLRQEKLFRKLYSAASKNKLKNIFDMDTSKYNQGVGSVIEIMLGYPLRLLYGALIVIALFIYKITNAG